MFINYFLKGQDLMSLWIKNDVILGMETIPIFHCSLISSQYTRELKINILKTLVCGYYYYLFFILLEKSGLGIKRIFCL